MPLAIKWSASAFALAGSIILISATQATAADMSAEEKYNEAYNKCETLAQGQRSFCKEEAYSQYQVDQAKANNEDITVHHDYNKENDSSDVSDAKQAWYSKLDECEGMERGNREDCMNDAWTEYQSKIGQ